MAAGSLRRVGYLDDVSNLLDQGVGWAGLAGDAPAFALALACRGGRWLVIVDQQDRAHRLVRALRFFLPDPGRVAHFPADDNRPYDGFSPDPDRPRRRLQTLDRVRGKRDLVVVASARALMQRVPDASTRAAGTLTVRKTQTVERDAAVRRLSDAGYLVTARVTAQGQLAVRGDVVDLWPAGRSAPIRIDWFDDEIESIRTLDPSTGRLGREHTRVGVLPCREERLDAPALDRLHRELSRHVAAQGRGVQLRRRVYEELKAGVRFSAVEDWLPALVPTASPLEALDGLRPVCWLPEDVQAAARDFERKAAQRWEALDEDERPLVPPSERYIDAEALVALTEQAHPILGISGRSDAVDLQATAADAFAVRGSELGPVVGRITSLAASGCRVGLVVEDGLRADRLLDLLEPHGLQPKAHKAPLEIPREEVALLVGDLPSGFVAPDSGWAFIPTSALFGGAARRAHRQERISALF